MRVVRVPLDKLLADPANMRSHDQRNLDAIKASLLRFGQQKPIVVGADGVVVAGNGTLEAARALGWGDVAAVRTDLEGSDRTAYAIADNRTAELAGWDDQLGDVLASLRDEDAELFAAAGFTDAELDAMLPSAKVTEDEEPDEGPAVSKVGEVYALGEHRLVCGDSTDDAVRGEVLAGAAPRLWVCDPPYDVPYDAWPLMPSVDVVAVWHRSDAAYRWMADTFRERWGSHSLVFTGGVRGQHNHTLPACMHELVTVWRRHWWDDKMDAIDRDVIAGSGCKSVIDGRHVSWQEHSGGVVAAQSVGMSWAKPVMQSEIAVAYVPRGSVVVDWCAGSGSSLIASAKHGRVWRGAELNPKWADLIRRRWGRWSSDHGHDAGDAL